MTVQDFTKIKSLIKDAYNNKSKDFDSQVEMIKRLHPHSFQSSYSLGDRVFFHEPRHGTRYERFIVPAPQDHAWF
jgi:hypothetical protein